MSCLSAKALEWGGGAEITGTLCKKQDFPPLPLHSKDVCSLTQSALAQRDVSSAGTMRWTPEWVRRNIITYKGLSFY